MPEDVFEPSKIIYLEPCIESGLTRARQLLDKTPIAPAALVHALRRSMRVLRAYS